MTAALLYGWALDTSGYGNAYYAAAVRSMSQSWSNFFFGAFDPLDVSTVDKSPASLWAQVVSVKVFGFHRWALILPQVVFGVATVAVLLVCAAYCVTRALSSPRALRRLVGAGVLVGAGFTTKMMAAWLVVPALFPAYLFFGSGGFWRRVQRCSPSPGRSPCWR
ncbi:glycosyltransferase family 39 protein [Nonomuraea sp. NPDC050556]|uniref:glycosyltransferase family 39 protein n=1 Tax=Nonomuraea sp. NPDC050556 TaxID=3364369 RepID=UPI00378C6EFE